jgi:hypothetical protein
MAARRLAPDTARACRAGACLVLVALIAAVLTAGSY